MELQKGLYQQLQRYSYTYYFKLHNIIISIRIDVI